jgi:hypothetical protein
MYLDFWGQVLWIDTIHQTFQVHWQSFRSKIITKLDQLSITFQLQFRQLTHSTSPYLHILDPQNISKGICDKHHLKNLSQCYIYVYKYFICMENLVHILESLYKDTSLSLLTPGCLPRALAILYNRWNAKTISVYKYLPHAVVMKELNFITVYFLVKILI